MQDSTAQRTQCLPADAAGIATAVRLLQKGATVALPTETVYGLAANADDGAAVARIYRAKGRPALNPLIVHVADRAMAARYARFSALAERLEAHFWPGPLTLVLPVADHAPVSALVLAGLSTIALRVSDHPVMQSVIRTLGHGVAAPSANKSGQLSPTAAAHVLHGLDGAIPLILDGGPTRAGVESSIVQVHEGHATLLRHGAIPKEAIEAAIGHPLDMAIDGAAIAAPGMLLGHYAPRLPLRLDAMAAEPREWHIGFGDIPGDASLSRSGDLVEAAARLFLLLHQADASGRAAIAVAPVPEHGLGAAINDRLRRAARS